MTIMTGFWPAEDFREVEQHLPRGVTIAYAVDERVYLKVEKETHALIDQIHEAVKKLDYTFYIKV